MIITFLINLHCCEICSYSLTGAVLGDSNRSRTICFPKQYVSVRHAGENDGHTITRRECPDDICRSIRVVVVVVVVVNQERKPVQRVLRIGQRRVVKPRPRSIKVRGRYHVRIVPSVRRCGTNQLSGVVCVQCARHAGYGKQRWVLGNKDGRCVRIVPIPERTFRFLRAAST